MGLGDAGEGEQKVGETGILLWEQGSATRECVDRQRHPRGVVIRGELAGWSLRGGKQT